MKNHNILVPPTCPKQPKELTMHDDIRVDNYYWLNERENPDVIKYLEDENQYTKDVLQHTEPFQEALFQEITGRIKQTDESVPYKLRGYYYITKYEEGNEHPVYTRKKESLDNDEQIILDVNALAEGHDYYKVGGQSLSPSNQILAYGVDNVSRRIYTIHFKNLETGEMLADTIENTTGSTTWGEDNKTVFYTVKDKETLRSYRIYKHTLGTPQSEDVLIYEEKDDTFSCSIYKTKSRAFIVIGTYSTLTTEYRVLDANTPNGEFRTIHARERGIEYYLGHYKDHFYINTNWDAENFRLMKAGLDTASKEDWEELIPHREEVLLEGIEIFDQYLVVEERAKGLTQLRVIKWATDEEYYIDFGEDAYTAYTSVNPEFETNILRYGYTSLTTPSSTFDFNMDTKERVLLKQQEVVGGYESSEYQSERIYVEVRDGAKVPVSLVYKKGTPLDGSAPLLQYAYGSYGSSMDVYFSSVRLSLLDRGFIYAIAHIRGGEELGRPWYENGKLLKKINTFNDFVDVAEYLVENKYTSPANLCAMGGSAGGLLMGAVINQKPELFKAVVAQVPFVDVVTTMLDDTIPLTTGEYDEWGNPNDKVYYDYMKSYSPYDNVMAKAYPSMLVTTGLHDSQVQYWEPAKWVAKLRELKTDHNTLLLHTDMTTGHGGKSGRFEQFHELALEYAYLFDQVGISE